MTDDVFNFFPYYGDELTKDNVINLKEFRDLEYVDSLDGFYNHQIFVQRLMSPFTKNSGLLLKHAMGTGKTCLCFLVIYSFAKLNKADYFLILSANQELSEMFKRELYICLERLQTSFDEKLSLKKNLEKYIQFETFSYVTRKIERKYKLVIIDEAHLIHLEKESPKKIQVLKEYNLYEDMLKFVEVQNSAKKILVTGTPIVNGIKKMFQLMNLILPKEDRFDKNFTYDSKHLFEERFVLHGEYVEKFENRDGLFAIVPKDSPIPMSAEKELVLKKEYLEIIERKLAGKISSYDTVTQITKKYFPGSRNLTINGKTSYLKVHLDYMSDFQRDACLNCKTSDQMLYTSLFAYPNELNFDECVNKPSEGYKYYSIKQQYRDLIKSNLKEYSSLYYNVISQLEDNKTESAMFYNEHIGKNGIALFSALLKLFDYKPITNFDKDKLDLDVKYHYKRFAIVTTDFGITSKNDISDLAKLFSHPENKFGKYLKVIIGGRKIAFGFSFINGRQAHILVQSNYPVMEQAEKRLFRGRCDHTGDDNYIKIFYHVPFYEHSGIKPYFVSCLERLELKKKKQDQLLKIMDNSSVNRFVINSDNIIDDVKVGFNNYLSLYKQTSNSRLKSWLQKIFKQKSSIHIDEISLEYEDKFLLLDEIYNLVYNQTLIKNDLEIHKYICVKNNILFLNENPFVDSLEEIISDIVVGDFFVKPHFTDNCYKEEFSLLKGFFNLNDKDFYTKLNIFQKILLLEDIIKSPNDYTTSLFNNILDIEKKNVLKCACGYLYIHKLRLTDLQKIYSPHEKNFSEAFRVFDGKDWKDATLKEAETIKDLFVIEYDELLEIKENLDLARYDDVIKVFKSRSMDPKKKTSKGIDIKTLQITELQNDILYPIIDLVNLDMMDNIQDTFFGKKNNNPPLKNVTTTISLRNELKTWWSNSTKDELCKDIWKLAKIVKDF